MREPPECVRVSERYPVYLANTPKFFGPKTERFAEMSVMQKAQLNLDAFYPPGNAHGSKIFYDHLTLCGCK